MHKIARVKIPVRVRAAEHIKLEAPQLVFVPSHKLHENKNALQLGIPGVMFSRVDLLLPVTTKHSFACPEQMDG